MIGGRTRSLGIVGALVVACVALASCSSNGTSNATTTASVPTSAPGGSSTTAPAPTGTTGVEPVYEVTTGSVKGIGTVLVDGQGMTLYLFEPDDHSGHSTCYGICASGWPPLALPPGATNPVAGPGIDAGLLATTTRHDGTKQLTYNGWPLYLWVNDSAPGQATGQGLNNLGGVWWTVTPRGAPNTTPP